MYSRTVKDRIQDILNTINSIQAEIGNIEPLRQLLEGL